MILLVTNERDLTTDYVVRELVARGRPFLRLNTERFDELRIALHPLRPEQSQISFQGCAVALRDIGAAYFRRPGAQAPPDAVADAAEGAYVASERAAALKSLYLDLAGRWLNAPWDIFAAEDKPSQLKRAAAAGLRVPDTVVTNDLPAIPKSPPARIAKPLRTALLEDEDGPGRVIFTSDLPDLGASTERAVALAPMIVQTKIMKTVDIRVPVIGSQAFATAIHSQAKEPTRTDWRRGSDPELPHERHELPGDVHNACVALTAGFGLRFGAIDLVRDAEGSYWFLEINPNGQWAWIEQRTGAPLTSRLVDELTKIADGR